jgi:hypothetical protein
MTCSFSVILVLVLKWYSPMVWSCLWVCTQFTWPAFSYSWFKRSWIANSLMKESFRLPCQLSIKLVRLDWLTYLCCFRFKNGSWRVRPLRSGRMSAVKQRPRSTRRRCSTWRTLQSSWSSSWKLSWYLERSLQHLAQLPLRGLVAFLFIFFETSGFFNSQQDRNQAIANMHLHMTLVMAHWVCAACLCQTLLTLLRILTWTLRWRHLNRSQFCCIVHSTMTRKYYI